FKHWSDRVVEGFTVTEPVTELPEPHPTVVAVRELSGYFAEMFARRRAQPRDDLITKLLTPRGGESLGEGELFWFCLLLLVAGNETTTNLLGNLLLALLVHPDQFALVRERPDLVPAAVEEALRYEAPIQSAFRTTTAPYRVGDTLVPADARVQLIY